jgi:ABC-type sugar transport system permease subunit
MTLLRTASATSRELPQRRHPVRGRHREIWVTVVLMLPALILAAVFLLYPIINTIQLSFQDWPGLGPATSAGFSNFTQLVSDPGFRTAITNNLLFAVVVTAGTVGLGTVLALAIDNRVRFWRIYRFVFFLPYVMPITVVAIMWSNALDPNFGWVTHTLSFIPGVSDGLLDTPSSAIWGVCWVAIWQLSGFPMVYMVAALSTIPPEVEQAAQLDGAGPVKLAWRVSLPMVRDTLATVVLLQLIFSFKVFDLVQALTQGGPGNSTQVLGTLIYRDAFINNDFGYASAVAVVATIIIVLISLAYLAVFKPGKIERHG